VLGLDFDEERPSHKALRGGKGGLSSIDIVLHGHAKTCIHVEGPTHYTINTHEYVGRTRDRNTVLEHHGWKVIQVGALSVCN
jgi:very-short-patch-repair endonuclease